MKRPSLRPHTVPSSNLIIWHLRISGASHCVCSFAQVGLDLITSPVTVPRKTKIVCTLGPACWSEEGLAALLDAGLNVARFNFSHGDHKGHLEVGGWHM